MPLACHRIVPEDERFSDRVLISAQDLSKAHPSRNREAVPAIRNVRLDIRRNEFVAVVGPSGCGKSTLLNILAGLYAPDSGHVLIDGHTARGASIRTGHISQTDTLLPWRNVLENVEIGLEIRGVGKRRRRAIAEGLIEQVSLRGFEKSYPFELSGGMRKRAAVIRTLAYDPEIIFMDEPFVGLDVQTRDMLEEDILRIWQETRKTILFVTHDLAEAITLADRVVLLTARPGTVKSEYAITLPRPRSAVETKFTPQFIRIHKRIWEDLSAEVVKSFDGSKGS